MSLLHLCEIATRCIRTLNYRPTKLKTLLLPQRASAGLRELPSRLEVTSSGPSFSHPNGDRQRSNHSPGHLSLCTKMLVDWSTLRFWQLGVSIYFIPKIKKLLFCIWNLVVIRFIMRTLSMYQLLNKCWYLLTYILSLSISDLEKLIKMCSFWIRLVGYVNVNFLAVIVYNSYPRRYHGGLG